MGEKPPADIDLDREWMNAVGEYAKECGGRLDQENPGPDQVVAMIRKRKEEDKKHSAKLKKFEGYVADTMTCLLTIGNALNSVASLVRENLCEVKASAKSYQFFGPSTICINAVSFFVNAAMAYNKIFDDLDELWANICGALGRVKIYKDYQGIIDPGMKHVASQILLQFIGICRLSTRILRPNYKQKLATMLGSAFGKDSGVSNGLKELTKLVQLEGQTRGAYSYVTVKNIDKNVIDGFSEMRRNFSQQSQGINQVDEKVTEVKGILARSDRQYQLEVVHRNLVKPDIDQERHYTSCLRVPNTCEWIFDNGDYRSWVEGDSVESSILFLTGDEGCGKTYLVSAILQNLIKHYPQGKEETGQISVACYFFRGSKKESKESTRSQIEEQYCTTHMAVKALSYQVAKNDPIYRKNLLNLGNDKIVSTNDAPELWNNLFSLQEQSAKTYFVIDGTHELDDLQLLSLGQVLKEAISQSSKPFSKRFLVTGRSENIESLVKVLGRSTMSIKVSNYSDKDVALFVRREVDNIQRLSRLDDLRNEICTSLTEITGITFGQADFFLQKIRNKKRSNEIREVLEKAKQNNSFHDNITDDIEECNQMLRDDDIHDLNQLLEWTMSVDWNFTISELEAVLHIRPGTSSSTPLDSLYSRLKSDFSTFFILEPDQDIPNAEVKLRSDKIKEYFETSSQSEHGDSQLSKSKISKVEVEIIDRFLKTLCDESLYEKFEFEQFFKDKTRSESKITVNIDEMHAKVALDCIRVMRGETDQAFTDVLDLVAHVNCITCLDAADLSNLSPKLKSDIGSNLVPMFYGNKVVEFWRFGGFRIVESQQEATVLKWFGDTAAMKGVFIDTDTKVWIESIMSNATSEHDLLEHVAKAAAKLWLLDDSCEDLFDKLEVPFRFVRGYHNKVSGLPLPCVTRLTKEMQIKQRNDPSVKRFTWEDYWETEPGEDLSELLNWAQEHDIDTEITYVSCFRVAETYRILENYDVAKEWLEEAIRMQPDNSEEAQRSLAKLYSQKNDFDLAVKTMQPVVERLKTLSDPTERQQKRLIDCLEDIATWNKRLGKYDKAMQIYQDILCQDAENYEIVCEILSVLADQNASQQILDHLNNLSTQTDVKTGNDRLTQLLVTCADSEEVHNIISHSARELKCSNLIREIYEKAIGVAEKVKAASGPRDDKQAEMMVAIVQLKNHLANSLHRHNESEVDTMAAVDLWNEITTLQVDTRYTWTTYMAKRSAATQVCLYYMTNAGRQVQPDANAAQAQIESLFKGLSEERERPLEDYEIKRMLGYYLSSIGQQEQARAQLDSAIKLGVELLSDTDVSNDYQGYQKLADVFMRLNDKDNALAAWSLLGPDKNVPSPPLNGSLPLIDSTSRLPDIVVNGTSSNTSEKTSAEANGVPAAAPAEMTTTTTDSDPAALDSPPRGAMRRATSDLAKKWKATKVPPKGPLQLQCDCHRPECVENRGRFTYANDFYYCKQCPNVQFTPECLTILRQGKMRRHVCNKDHDFFHVPHWDFEKAWRVGKGNVQVGEEIMTVQDWLGGIRRDWGIEQRSSGDVEEGKKEDERQ